MLSVRTGMSEPRLRQSGSFDSEEACTAEYHFRKVPREVEKRLENCHFGAKEKPTNCKSLALKLVLLSLFLAASLTFLFPPFSFDELRRNISGSFTESARSKERYYAQIGIDWSEISSLLDPLKANRLGHLKIGLVNVDRREEIQEWQSFLDHQKVVHFHLEHLYEDLQWTDLFPEWIDEEQQFEVPKCPRFPMPFVRKGTSLDLVVAKLPCHQSPNRDAVHLQVELAAANVASSTQATHVLLLSSCKPLPNVFTCRELIAKRHNAWLYKVDPAKLRQKVVVPVGSCELAVPLEGNNIPSVKENVRREAYATILHSAQLYVCGAITVAQSIRMTGSTRDLIILVDENIESEQRLGLEAAGWLVIEIQRIRNPKAEPEAYNEWNYSKFRLWQLTSYDKVIFIDADLLVLRNIDFLFELPEISATGNNATLFNSGVMIIEPSNCTFQLLMDEINEIVSYNGGDQGYLNEVFTWWHRIPKRMNYLKHFWSNDTEEFKIKTRLFGADPPELYVLHYLGLKPWVCFRDYDCNWNVENQRSYASDVAHALWWKVHDSMPKDLHKFCLLHSKQKAGLEWNRRQAQNVSFPDKHWKRNITDSRLQVCNEKFCYWESMLWHWGDPNYDKGDPSANMTVPRSPA